MNGKLKTIEVSKEDLEVIAVEAVREDVSDKALMEQWIHEKAEIIRKKQNKKSNATG